MAGISLEEFKSRVFTTCSNSPIVQSATVFALRETVIRLRVVLVNETFVDVFYNEQTGTTSFAQVHNKNRVFGADNAGGWRWHPRNDPASHISAESEISFEEFMARLESDLE